jgi:uncharacterized protein YcbK (DUF882 family)
MAKPLSPHFLDTEFACNHCGKLPENGIAQELIDLLERVREHFGTPVVVNSGYRCPTHNRNVKGASNSQHLLGTAADIRVVDHPPSAVQAYLKSICVGKYGIGSYKTFTHVDVRKKPARW